MLTCLISFASWGQVTFNYTGSAQTYTVPAGITLIQIEAYGAQGGGLNGGLGGEAIATIPVTPGAVLEVYVGQNPTTQTGAGGWNGGGACTVDPCAGGGGWQGGGASDVRVAPYALANRIIVAGGGGGEGWSDGVGGAGGGTTGVDGEASWIAGTHGLGGTAVAGGAGGPYASGPDSPAPSGTFGVGGGSRPLSTYCTGGGGGGGWYGGGGGYVSAGGGGSSYVSYPGSSSTSTTSGVNSGHGYIVITEVCTGLTTSVSDDTLCEGEMVTLSASSTGAGTITWDGGVSDGVPFTPPVGTTTYTATSSDGGDCPFSVDIVVFENPTVEAGPNVFVCGTDELALNGSGTADAFSWDGGVIDGVNFLPPLGTTMYTVTGVDFVSGCQATDSVEVLRTDIDETITVAGGVYTSNQAGAAYQWVTCPAYTDIAGETSQSFTPTADGEYAVIVSLNGCEDTSACTAIAGVGIDEWNSRELILHPNPTNGNVQVQLEGEFEYVVLNMLGQEIMKGQGKDNAQFDLSEQMDGVYIIKVLREGKVFATQIIKE